MERPIRELLRSQRGPTIVAARLDAPVAQAVASMNAARVGSVLVLGRDGRMAGIFTERDVLTRVVEAGRDPNTTLVGTVMTPSPVRVGPDTSMSRAQAIMRAHDVCHLPVVEDGRVIGVVALRDIVVALAEDSQTVYREVQRYLHGPAARAPETFAGAASLPQQPPGSGAWGAT